MCNKYLQLSPKLGGLSPIHIACALPGDEGVEITQVLLDALADPDVRAASDDSFLNTNMVSHCTIVAH